MQLRLTVIDGPALVWNGTPVRAPWELIAHLRPGMTVVAECSFAGGLAVDEAHPVRPLSDGSSESGPGPLIDAGEFDAALRVIDAREPTADTLAFRARALLERHRATERRTMKNETNDLEMGVTALADSLRLGGPGGPVDAANSVWTSWTLLREEERRPHQLGLSVELYRWIHRALPRSSIDAIEDFTPFAPLLEGVPAELWPRPPWLAWGLSPTAIDPGGFARALCDRLEPRASSGVQELITAIRNGTQPSPAARTGRGAAGLLSGLQVALHSSRPRHPITIALTATRKAPARERVEWFSVLNDALAVGAVTADLRAKRKRLSAEIDRVLFRACDRYDDTAPSISLLKNGRLLAVVPTERRINPVVLEGELDDVVAAMPEAHFALAVVATREALDGRVR